MKVSNCVSKCRQIVVGIVAAGAVLVLATPVHADAIADDWQTNHGPYTWSQWGVGFYKTTGGALPTDFKDWLRVHYRRYLYLDSSEEIGMLQMYAVGGSTLSITNGGALTVSSAGGQSGEISLSQAGGPTGPGGEPNVGIINVETGGTLTSANTGGRVVLTGDSSQFGSLNLNGGTFNAEGTTGADVLTLRNVQINLNSGTFNMTGGQIFVGNGGAIEVNINGDQTSISMDSLNASDPLSGGDFNFSMDADGISTVTVGGGCTLKNIDIEVDGTDYEGGTADFTLFSASVALSLPDNAPTTTGFPGAATVTFNKVGNDYVMSVHIPEGTVILIQ